MELAEFKKTIEDLGRGVAELRTTVDEKIKNQTKGIVDSMLEEKLAKVNTEIDRIEGLKKELDRLSTTLNRKSVVDKDGNELPADFTEAKKAYQGFLRKGVQKDGERESKQFEWDQKSLSVVSDSDGGYTVTADMSGRIVKKVFETSPVRAVAAQQTIGTDALEGVYDLDESSFGWVAETGARPSTGTPKMGKWRIPVFEMYAAPVATQKLLDDSNVDIEAWLAGHTSDKFARSENSAFVNGNGVTQPRGFLTLPAGTSLPGTIEQVTSAVSGTLSFDDLINTIYTLKTAYRNNAQWAMNRSTIGYVRQLKDSQGRYLWEPGMQLGQPSRLLDYALNEFNDMPAIAGSALAVCFADWKEFYQIVDRAGIRVLRDPFTNKPYVIFYTTKRVGGAPLNFEAGKILKVHA